MATISIGKNTYKVKFNADSLLMGHVNDKEFTWSFEKIDSTSFHIILNNRSFKAHVAKRDLSNQTLGILINQKMYNLTFSGRLDEMMKVLGIDKKEDGRDNIIKAPMPGLVLDIPIKVNQKVNMNDTVIILEAMKMENNIKSPKEATIKECLVEKGATVEKNQVLITLK
jgi:biotin carboxyl carrier protein